MIDNTIEKLTEQFLLFNQELLVYMSYQSIFIISVSCFISIICLVIYRIGTAELKMIDDFNKDKEYSSQRKSTDTAECKRWASITILCFCIVMIGLHVNRIIKIKFAPRVFVVEYLKNTTS